MQSHKLENQADLYLSVELFRVQVDSEPVWDSIPDQKLNKAKLFDITYSTNLELKMK